MGDGDVTKERGQELPALRALLLNALRAQVGSELLVRAEARQQETGGLLSTALAAVGVPADQVRAALSAASGYPVAPRPALENPDLSLARMSKSNGWRQIHAAPFARNGALVRIAFANPSVLASPLAARLPPHEVFVALESDLAEVLKKLGQAASGPVDARPGGAAQSVEKEAGAPHPERLGDYLLERELGAGGMATVYLARESGSGRKVALKVMSPQLAKDPEFIARFINEARASSGLRHPNIVEVFAYGEEKGRPFIASEWVDGETLQGLLERVGALPIPVALEIFAQMLEAVGHAHERGIIHRDLKPANLLLSRTGWAKLTDFGIAKTAQGAGLTQTGATLGTPAYMSPEQASGRALDARSDLFAAGVVLYEMVTGKNPHEGDTPMSSLAHLLEPRTPPVLSRVPGAPAEVTAIIDRLLERDVSRRPTAAREVLDALAPQLAPVRSRHPGLLVRFFEAPAQVSGLLDRETAAQLADEARALLKQGLTGRRRAAFLLFRASRLAPGDAELRAVFEGVVAAERLRASPSVDPKIASLEQQVALEQTPELLQRLAGLHRREGNVFRAAELLTLSLALQPEDGQARATLELLRGDRAQTLSGPIQPALPSGPSTGELAVSLARDLGGELHSVGRRRLLWAGAGLLAAVVGFSLWRRRANRLEAEAAAEHAAREQELFRAKAAEARAAAEEARAMTAAKAAEGSAAATARQREEEARQWRADVERMNEADRREEERRQAEERAAEAGSRDRARGSGSAPVAIPSGGWIPPFRP